MHVVYIFGAGLAYFLFLLSLKNRSNTADKLLSLLLFSFALHLSLYYIWDIVTDKYGFLNFRSFIPLVYGPLIYLYIYYAGSKSNFEKVHLWHFVLFIVSTGVTLVIALIHLQKNIPAEAINSRGLYTIGKIIVISISAAYFGACFVRLGKYKHGMLQQFSFTETIDLKWIQWLLYGLFITWALTLCFMVLNRINLFVTIDTERAVIYLILCCFIFFIGFKGIKQTKVFTYVPSLELTQKSCQPLGYSQSDDLELYFDRICKLFEKEKLYQNPRLSVNDISNRMGVNVNYISRAINTVGRCNFYEFVNTYRVNNFKEEIVKPENANYTFLAIAYQCGFNSKATFNRIFKNKTNLTPLEFKTKYLQELRLRNS